MSIKAMTWAFSLPLEPRAKLALLAIADNARDDGIAWPSRETIAEKSTQSRATINRRLKILTELGVLGLFERFREDGSQTTDEIRLDLSMTPEQVMQRMQGLSAADRGESAEEHSSHDSEDEGAEEGKGGYQPDTPPVQSGHPGGAVVTGGGLQSGHPLNEPSLEPKSLPLPPPGALGREDGPLKKADKDAIEKRDALWRRFLGVYPTISAMDQQAARAEFDQLSIDDAEWAVSVCPLYDAECRKLKKPPKNAHLWVRKAMFRNYPRAKIAPPPPEQVWIVEGSDEDRALRMVRHLTKAITPRVGTGPDGTNGYPHPHEVGPDLLAMLEVASEIPSRWTGYPRGSPEFAAWQTRFAAWIGRGVPIAPGEDGIRVPWRWPPSKKNGKLYPDDDAPPNDDQDQGEPTA